jgi:hypothetical protein
VQGEPPEAILDIPTPKNPSKNHHLAPKMEAEKIPPFFQFEASSAPKTTTATVTVDPEDCPFDGSLIPTRAKATKAANLVQEPLAALYRKAKTNKLEGQHSRT